MNRWCVGMLLVFISCGKVEEVKVNNAPVAVLTESELKTFPLHPVILDGTNSYDPDGDPVYYHWELKSSPTGSEPVLSGRSSPFAVLYPDLPGIYEISFYVSDGDLSSSPLEAVIYVLSDAFQPQAFIKEKVVEANVNETVLISGIMSLNPIDTPLLYEWKVVSKPQSSEISFPDVVSLPYFSFSPDVPHGVYLVVLRVYNQYSEGTTDWVKVVVRNTEPEVDLKANVIDSYDAGSSIYVDDKDRVRFENYSSFDDADGDELSYRWTYSYTHRSGALPVGDGFVCPSQGSGVFDECVDSPDRVIFTVGSSADGEGVYEITLEVDDGYDTVRKKVLLMRQGAPPPSIDVDNYRFPHRWKDGIYSAEGNISVIMENLYMNDINVLWSVEVKRTPGALAPVPSLSPSEGSLSIPAFSQFTVDIHLRAETQETSIIGKYTFLFKACLAGGNTCSRRTFFVYVENTPPSLIESPHYMVFSFNECSYLQLGEEVLYVGEPPASFLLPIYAEDNDGDPLEVEVSYGNSTLINLVSLEGNFIPTTFDMNSGIQYEKNVVLCALPWTCGTSSWGWVGAMSNNKYTELVIWVKDPWKYGPVKKVRLYPECY